MVDNLMRINGQFIGTFNYSYSDLLNSPASIDNIIELAWGRLALNVGNDRYGWGVALKELAQSRPDDSLKLLIDEIRVSVGRDPATSSSPLLVDVELQKYYVLTPKNYREFLDGTIVNKIRSVSILPLTDDQVSQLEAKGYDVEPIGIWSSIDAFAKGFPDPIALELAPKTIINGQPVTIFPDGRTSLTNEGTLNPIYISPILHDPSVKYPTDINGTEISIPIADNIINNLGGSPNDGTPSGQEQVAPSKNSDVIVPLGILALLGGVG